MFEIIAFFATGILATLVSLTCPIPFTQQYGLCPDEFSPQPPPLVIEWQKAEYVNGRMLVPAGAYFFSNGEGEIGFKKD